MPESLVPEALSAGWAAGLIVLSFFTSGFTAAFGIGGGVALITVLLQILPPAVVLPLHGIVQAGSNGGRAYAMRTSVNWRIVRWFVVGSVLGIGLASLLFFALPTRVLLVCLAAFILWSLWAPKFKASDIPEPGFLGVGALASFLTMFLGATGPVVAAFWNQKRMGKEGQVATHGAVMFVQHGLKCVAFGFLGFAFSEWLPFIIAMVVAGYLGTLVGKKVLSRLPEATFAIGFKWTLTLLALRLAWQGLVAS